ncbi:MAG: metallophosphoesterase family protein [Planctomycetes bacterium]|nr:metallophosphoesterase family protein [Planctomycetota bacterium]
MKRAILSDIHANLAAFEAVLADVEASGVEEIYCLGDVIGYGPDPRECIQKARSFKVNLLGNHEEAVLFGAIGFNPKAKIAIDWTREQLNLESRPQEENRDLWNFIGGLDKEHRDGEFLYVHGSPRDPTREYIFKQDFKDRKKMDAVFAAPIGFKWKVCFAGHTHHPGIFVEQHPHSFIDPSEVEYRFEYAASPGRFLVNVGSVGQPRDGDWRASYVIVDADTIHFRRIEYDVQRTLRRFDETPALPEYLARRLQEGK